MKHAITTVYPEPDADNAFIHNAGDHYLVFYKNHKGVFSREQDAYYKGVQTLRKRLLPWSSTQGVSEAFDLEGNLVERTYFKVVSEHASGNGHVECGYSDPAMTHLVSRTFLNDDFSTNRMVCFYPSGNARQLILYDHGVVHGECCLYPDIKDALSGQKRLYEHGVLKWSEFYDAQGELTHRADYPGHDVNDYILTERVNDLIICCSFKASRLEYREIYKNEKLVRVDSFTEDGFLDETRIMKYLDEDGEDSYRVYLPREYNKDKEVVSGICQEFVPGVGLMATCPFIAKDGSFLLDGVYASQTGMVRIYNQGHLDYTCVGTGVSFQGNLELFTLRPVKDQMLARSKMDWGPASVRPPVLKNRPPKYTC